MNQYTTTIDNLLGRLCAASVTISLALVLLLASGCSSRDASKSQAESSSQTTFAAPEQAVDALVAAARTQDDAKLTAILGEQSDKLLYTGDAVADQQLLETFLKSYDEKHQLVAGQDGAMTLVVGKSDWPMPIPIVQEDGKWRFDTKAGEEEILNRRIGHNELSAIQTCLAILDAQREYVAHDRNANGLCEYATRFVSSPGTKDGLFWPTGENEPPSPLGPLVAAAAAEGYKKGDPAATSRPAYHGYHYRILTRQGASAPGGALDYMVDGKLIGGFAIVAWPATYGNSGIMTFIMNHDGIVYQRDLGDSTDQTAESMNAYDPGPEWKKADAQKPETKPE